MNSRPRILITNDDGIQAPGIQHLCRSLREIADVTVVAPSTEQSAAGLAITIRHPLRIVKMETGYEAPAWHINGTPADCVKLALSVILTSPPNLIVSGINRGTNAGRNILYSGTVAAVIEGIMHEVPGIAFSCEDFSNPDYKKASEHVPAIVEHVLKHPLPRGSLLNVNFPSTKEFCGIKLTRQGKEFWLEDPDERYHPAEGSTYYWLGAKRATYNEYEDSDIAWLKQGYIAAVPVHVEELTDHAHIHSHKDKFEKLFTK